MILSSTGGSAAKQKAWRDKNPGKTAIYSKRYKEKYPDRVIASRWSTKRRRKLKQWGITAEDLQLALERQGGLCALCPKEVTTGGGSETHLDHCHETGKFRGILCRRCNLRLGKFESSPEWVIRATAYIKESS